MFLSDNKRRIYRKPVEELPSVLNVEEERDGKAVRVTLAESPESTEWTLHWLSPGMELSEVLASLDQKGITIERQDMQYYATGIELESVGIQRLEWDANETISYVAANVDTAKKEALGEYGVGWQDELYRYVDEERNVHIRIGYPVISLPEHKEARDQLKANIESTIQRILQTEDPSSLRDVTVNVHFSIENTECENFSILWAGTIADVSGEREICTALTCNLLQGGCLQKMGDNYFDFYVTPLRVVTLCPSADGKSYEQVSAFR